MYRRLPAEDLMKEATTDITRRAIDLTNKLMLEDEKLTLDEAVDQAIDTFRKEGLFFVRRSVRPPRTASQSSYQFTERTGESVLAENVDQSYKNISVQKIDIEGLLKSNASKKKEES